MTSLLMSMDHCLHSADLFCEPYAIETVPGFCEIVQVTIRNAGSSLFEGVIRLSIPLPSECDSPWIMVPGFLYGENRHSDMTNYVGRYPRFDPAISAPCEMSSSWWDFSADRCSSPLVFCHSGNRCFAVAAYPHYELAVGNADSDDPEPQIGIGFAAPTKGLQYIRISIPACEEPFTYSNAPGRDAATIRRIRLSPGSVIQCIVCQYDFRGSRHGYQHILEDYYGRMKQDHPRAMLPDIPLLVQDAMHGLTKAHYCPRGKYFAYTRAYDAVAEQIAAANGFTLEWHQEMTGFAGGLLVCDALLQGTRFVPDHDARQIAIEAAEKFCRDGISPSGLFWADYMPPDIESPSGMIPNPRAHGRATWGNGWLRDPDCVHSRTIADACDHLAGMILHEQAGTLPSPHLDLWISALMRNVEVILRLQQPDGTYGQTYHAVKGIVDRTDGCGGILWIPALLRVARLQGLPTGMVARINESVKRAGKGYARYVEAEHIWGAPEDNDSPTSEDGMNALRAYVDLYEAYGRAEHLQCAITAADWMLTFRKTYNQKLPDMSLMGRYGMRSRGGDFASSSNNHLHVFEVLCTRHLALLSQVTTNPYYRDRACDHWAFACQFLNRCDGMLNGFRGAMAEQFYWTDWGSWGNYILPAYHQQKGHMAAFSTVWCIAAIILGALDANSVFCPTE